MIAGLPLNLMFFTIFFIISLILTLNSKMFGKMISVFLNMFLVLQVTQDTLLNLVTFKVDTYNSTSGVFSYVMETKHVSLPYSLLFTFIMVAMLIVSIWDMVNVWRLDKAKKTGEIE